MNVLDPNQLTITALTGGSGTPVAYIELGTRRHGSGARGPRLCFFINGPDAGELAQCFGHTAAKLEEMAAKDLEEAGEE